MKLSTELKSITEVVYRCSECGEIVEDPGQGPDIHMACGEHPHAMINSALERVECSRCDHTACGHDVSGDPACEDHRLVLCSAAHSRRSGGIYIAPEGERFVCLSPAECRDRFGSTDPDGWKDVLDVKRGEAEFLTPAQAALRIRQGDRLFVVDEGSKGQNPKNPRALQAWYVWLE